MSDTPRTNEFLRADCMDIEHLAEFTKELERENAELKVRLAGMEEQLAASQMLYDMASKERDRLVKDWKTEASRCQDAILQRDTLAAENARLKDELDDWHNAAKHVEAEHPDEVHCGCVAILRKKYNDLRESMTEAWKLVNAMAGQEYWQRAEDWLAEHKEFAPNTSAEGEG